MTTRECEFDPDHLYHDHHEADELHAENEHLRAELADSLCASCKHPWRYHTSGGMCAGSAEYIECYCVMISPL